jgi:hypothetical protein
MTTLSTILGQVDQLCQAELVELLVHVNRKVTSTLDFNDIQKLNRWYIKDRLQRTVSYKFVDQTCNLFVTLKRNGVVVNAFSIVQTGSTQKSAKLAAATEVVTRMIAAGLIVD